MRQLIVRERARQQIRVAFDWYLARSRRQAERFIDEVDEAIRGIESAPERYHPVRGNIRRRLLAHFPYAVYYRIHATKISVVRVLRGSQQREKWLRG